MIAKTQVELYVRIRPHWQFVELIAAMPGMAQISATKSKKESYLAIKYQHIKKRRGHKKAVIAIAYMMRVCIY